MLQPHSCVSKDKTYLEDTALTTTSCVTPDLLSIWRSPIDQVAILQAQSFQQRQPQATITYGEDFTAITIFNFGQYITLAGGMPFADAALDDMFLVMTRAHSLYGNNGGLAYILQQAYSVNAYDPALQKHEVPDQCNILGCGSGGILAGSGSVSFFHFTITPQAVAPNDSWFLTCEGHHTDGGKWFRGLSFNWLQTNARAGDVCIYATTWNCNAVDCTFTNCPTAFYAAGESSGLERCMIYYSTGCPNNAVAVYLQAVQSFATGPGEYQQDSVGGGGPSGCTAIALGGGAGGGNLVHGVVSNLHLSEWSYGIHYGLNPGVSGTHVSFVQAHCYLTCVMMQPPSTGNNQINGEKYTACTFEKSADGVGNSPIVFIDTNGQGNGAITDIEFTNCSVYSIATATIPGLYCYQITSGSNIRIIGGTASNAGPGSGSAGIAVTPTLVSGGPAGPGRITVLGVDLNPSYPNVSGGGAQTYALVISANLQDVMTVDDCRMANYGSGGPILVTGSVINNLYIRNCQGYNDQNTTILSGTAHLPVTSVVSAGTAGTLSGGTSYYGPSLVIFTNNTATGALPSPLTASRRRFPLGPSLLYI